LKLSLGRLRDVYPGDGQLLAYADQLAQRLQSDHVVTEASLALIRAIRTHVSETYRVHRRMVRSRRSAHPEAIIARSRSSVSAVYDESDSARQVDSLLDEWRALAAAAVRDESQNSAVRVGMERVFLALVQSADG